MTRSGGPPTQRQLRVGEELRHLLAAALRQGRFRDPDLAEAANITVTEVRIGPDLRNATAFVMPLGGREIATVLAALNRASGYFRRVAAEELRLKFAPSIVFEADTSFDAAQRIGALLQHERVRADLATDDAGEGGIDEP